MTLVTECAAHQRTVSLKYRLATMSGGQESILSRGPMLIYAAEILFHRRQPFQGRSGSAQLDFTLTLSTS